MTALPFSYGIKDRTQLEKDLSKYVKNGGKVTVIETTEIRYTKQQVVRKGLYYKTHLPYVSKETEIPIHILKSIRRQILGTSDELLNKLYEFFKDRDLTKI